MKKQHGSSLVVALVFLTIITLVAVYSLEGSNMQSKMVANSLFSTLTYQECRNEQEANVRFYNANPTNKNELILAKKANTDIINGSLRGGATTASKSTVSISWRYMGESGIGNQGGYDADGNIGYYTFEHDCQATFRFATNSQTLGAKVQYLKVNDKVI